YRDNLPLMLEKGVLENGDLVLNSDGSVYDKYTFNGRGGQAITISLESTEFDTYLAIVDSNNQVIGENDDISGDNSNSALSVTLPRDDTYRIIVNGYDEKSWGSYTLMVQDK
ncbi:MAG: serine protease, partial [Okeania sp. SIO2D1]|nr:serine protease [Okeania sp. SIO2D1]